MSSTIIDNNGWKPAFGNPRNLHAKQFDQRRARHRGVMRLHREGKTPAEIAAELGGYSEDLICKDLADLGQEVRT